MKFVRTFEEYQLNEQKTAEDMLKDNRTKQILDSGFGDDSEMWVEDYHAKTKNYKPNTYYRVNRGGGMGESGVGKGLYLGKDKRALNNFYNMEGFGKMLKFKGNPKWMDLVEYDKFKSFEKYAKKLGVSSIDGSDKIGQVVMNMGYDGIRYYDPNATGEEFVLFNTKAVN